MPRQSRTVIPFALLGGVALVAILLVAIRSERLSLGGALCAGAALVVAVIPAALHLAGLRAGRLPILPLAALFYIPFFALPPLMLDLIWPGGMPIEVYKDAPILDGLDASVTGVILLGVVMLVTGMLLAHRLPPTFAARLPMPAPRRLAWLAWGMLALHAAFWLYPPLAAMSSVGQLLRPSGLLAGGLAICAMVTGAFTRTETALVLLVLFPARLLAGVLTGSLNNSLILVACLALLLSTLRPRTLVPMAAIVLLGVILYTPVQMYRTVTWTADQAGLSFAGRVERLLEGFRPTTGRGADQYSQGTWYWHPYASSIGILAWPLLKRLDQATVLGVVVEKTPGTVPPWNGHSLLNLLSGPVPRAIWPGKPEERFGNEFGRRYGLIYPNNTDMSVNLPWLTEFYVNFLYPGVVVGMLLTGLALGALDRLLNRPDANPVEMAFAATILTPLLVPESNISLMIGNLPAIGIILWLLLRLSLARSSASFIDKTGKIQ